MPYQHVGQTVEVRLTGAHIEVLRHDQRISLHRRMAPHQCFVTEPANLQAFRDPKIMQRAAGIGPATAALIDALFAQRRHPEEAIRSPQGALALARDHGAGTLETRAAVCRWSCWHDRKRHWTKVGYSWCLLP